MCYYALHIFLACGHAIRGSEPIHLPEGCPLRRKDTPNRRSVRPPSLSNSISTQSSPRTTISSIDSLLMNPLRNSPSSETPCDTRLSHPLHTHRIHGLCEACCEESRLRLAELDDAAGAEVQRTFVGRARRDKVIFEGKKPRQLQLIHIRDTERLEKAQAVAAAEAAMASSPPLSPISAKDSASTLNYMRGLWTSTMEVGLRSPNSPRTPSQKSAQSAQSAQHSRQIARSPQLSSAPFEHQKPKEMDERRTLGQVSNGSGSEGST